MWLADRLVGLVIRDMWMRKSSLLSIYQSLKECRQRICWFMTTVNFLQSCFEDEEEEEEDGSWTVMGVRIALSCWVLVNFTTKRHSVTACFWCRDQLQMTELSCILMKLEMSFGVRNVTECLNQLLLCVRIAVADGVENGSKYLSSRQTSQFSAKKMGIRRLQVEPVDLVDIDGGRISAVGEFKYL